MTDLSVRRAGVADRAVLERLWLMFRHDMSEFHATLPSADGTFTADRLHLALTDPDWASYLLMIDTAPVGIAFVRGLTGQKRVLNTFFVVRGVRRRGAGLQAVRRVTAMHAGAWEVAFQDANVGAVSFWRRAATEIAGDAWSEERRAVPHRPDLPPDVWISFNTPAPQ